MDGPVDAVWIENLNTVLDDNKKLCLSSGEIVKFTPKMTMMFEVEDLLEASPATVSRCGMVYLNPDKLGWQVLLHPWIQSLPTSVKIDGRMHVYSELVKYFIPNLMGYTFGYDQTLEEEKRLENLKPVIQVTKNWIFRSFISLFESLLLKNETRDSLKKKEQEQQDKEEAKRAYEEMQGLNRQETKRRGTRADENKISPQQKTEIFSLFLMAVTWSFGAPLHTSGRYYLSEFLQQEVQKIFKDPSLLSFGEDLQRRMVLEESGDYFSTFYHCEREEWLRWDHELDKFNIFGSQEKEDEEGNIVEAQEIEFQSILIPTEDTIRYSYILQSLCQHSFPVLFIGETGTGKTSAIKTFQSSLSKDEWELGQIVLSATSTAFQVQDYLQSKLEKQKKGVYGPKLPGHRLIIFIDDLNMPSKEKYGAQPPIEMLRQTIDNGGFYDLKSNELIKIVNVLFVSAMGIPGGGKTLPTKRLMRHFNLIHIPPFSNENLFRIFSKILEWGYSKYPDQWQRQIKTVTKLTIALYEKSIEVLLPLPSKSHYLFNLRQVSEIVQGLLMVPPEKVEKCEEKQRVGLLQRLWVHESIRVFSDRLINEDDKILFTATMKDTIQQIQPGYIDIDKINPDQIIFNNFVEFNPNDPMYEESTSFQKITKTINEIIEYYNQMNKEKIHLLIFEYVIQHLSRISRILYKPYGNGLLIGLGGNGRKSLSKLAAFINECVTFKVEISKSYGKNEWQEDLKAMFKSLGMDNKKIAFTFSDTDIKQEFFIEDINNILNVGEVPNLYTADEIEEIRFEMQKHIKKGMGDPFDVFVKRCKKNLHLLLFMSPAGPKLRQYIRQYPSLVNCTSIDWFLSWPEQALQTVSMFFLQQSNLFEVKRPNIIRRPRLASGEPLDIVKEVDEDKAKDLDKSNTDLQSVQQIRDKDQKQQFEEVEEDLQPDEKEYNQQILDLQTKVADIFVKIHNSTLNLAVEYFNEKNRQVYITPTRFIEIFKLFGSLMKRKHQQIDDERHKYIIGIQKLEEANVMVDNMKAQLEELKPILEQKSKQVEATMIHLDKESREVEAVKEVVDREAQIVFEQKEIAEGIKNECQTRLSEAQPLLDSALTALRTLNVKDFVTMKSYNSPPAPIKLALEAACIMLGITPKYVEGPPNKQTKKATKIPDYWEKSKKLLNDYKKFLSSLELYDKDNIPEDRIHKISEYLINPKFVPEEIRKASEAAEGICKWVIAICKYDVIAKEIRPKREALGLAQEKLNVVLKQLQEKEAELQKIIDKKNALEEEFKNQNFEKQNLIMQRDECQAKLGRATILMNSLGNEKERWLKTSDKLLKEKQSLLGDMILAAAFITYLGPFEGSYREKIVKQEWRYIIQHQDILVSDEFVLKDTIGVPSLIQQWQIKGLPSDNVSIENIIIIEETIDKWPLIIDPQGQALKFLKDYLDQDFISVKLQNDNYVRKLEPALINGQTVIVENIGESVDPAVNSIVCKEVFQVKGDKYIKFNDNQCEFNDKFRFYMVSNLANPHFQPDLQTKTRVLNFSVTKEGLEQQLLSIVCRNESERDEVERERLQRQNAEFQEQKRQIEEQILEQLRNSGSDILDDDSLVNSLNESKKITDDIKQKLQTSKIIEERIEESRKNYKSVAEHGAKLYFCVQEISTLDPMYQFSMKWYRDLFEKSFTYSEKIKDIKGRVKQLKTDFRKVLYSNICRSIFEHHKMMFAFNMAIKLNEDEGIIDDKGENNNFGKKLKELEQQQQFTHQHHDKPSGTGSGSHHGQGMNFQRRNTRSIIDKKSDTASQAGFNNLAQQLAQKNEEERLKIPKEELRYLLTGLVALDVEVDERTNPVESFLDNKTWQQILELATLDHFEMLPEEIEKNPVQWKRFVQSSIEPVPEPFFNLLPDFAMILLHKVLKQEKTIIMIQRYIEKALGSFFIRPIIYSLEEVFADSKPHIPIILILTPGNDPMEQIKKFGEEKARVPYPVSLGKGQGDKAKALINEIKQYGGWVVLQNCHLAESFLPELEQLIESIQPSMFQTSGRQKQDQEIDPKKEIRPPHPDFRLWLTSMSSDNFPFSILQNSIKLTSEPPKGIKSSLIRSYTQIDTSKAEREFFMSNSKQEQWKKLFLALTFFHGIVRERRRYGALGWNLKYDFNDSDFRISMRQLHLMIDTFDEVPFTALSYLTGECNYGGRVTDDWDRRTLNTILKDFYNKKVIQSKYEFVEGQKDYHILQEGEFEDYFEFVKSLPDEEFPQLVGLHPNANITYAINESTSIVSDVLSISKNSGGDAMGGQQTQQAIKMSTEILYQIREPFKIKEVEKKFPFKYEESMNSVLLQELARFNTLIEVVKSSLTILIKTLEGKLVMNSEIERMLKAIINNTVPDNWKARSYPSKKPLLSYIKDFQKRLQMLDDWIDVGQPDVFWVSGFFFTQSFLTGVKQNYARKYKYPIDKVTFTFEVLKQEAELKSQPENGCYCKGLYLEGAGWNNKDRILEESQPKILYIEMPTIHFLPILEQEVTLEKEIQIDRKNENDEEENEEESDKEKILIKYACPVYKTCQRAGTLSTTGHSTNYILTTYLPTYETEETWVKRSVAMISQLDD